MSYIQNSWFLLVCKRIFGPVSESNGFFQGVTPESLGQIVRNLDFTHE